LTKQLLNAFNTDWTTENQKEPTVFFGNASTSRPIINEYNKIYNDAEN
jgi:hypothetical protein